MYNKVKSCKHATNKEASQMKNTTQQHIELYGSKIIVAKDSDTGDYLRKFHSIQELRKIWPSAEIVGTEELEDCIVVYC